MATYSGSDKRLAYLFQNGGGGGGASALTDLTDVNISSPADGQALIYDGANQKWINGTGGGGGGSSQSLEVKTAAWIATSSNATNTPLTDSLNLSAGKYLLILQAPYTASISTQFYASISVDGIQSVDCGVLYGSNQYGQVCFVLELQASASVAGTTASGASFSWDSRYLDRGYLKAIRLDTVTHTYSTTEQVVGTWINGKPIYEITVKHTEQKAIAYHANYSFTAGLSDVDICVMCMCSYDPHWVSGNWRQNYSAYYNASNDTVYLVNEDVNMNSNTIDGVIAVIRYTKTTD